MKLSRVRVERRSILCCHSRRRSPCSVVVLIDPPVSSSSAAIVLFTNLLLSSPICCCHRQSIVADLLPSSSIGISSLARPLILFGCLSPLVLSSSRPAWLFSSICGPIFSHPLILSSCVPSPLLRAQAATFLGVLLNSKRVNLDVGTSGSARGECVYTTVSHFNIIRFQCHQEAKRADAALKNPNKEWEGATLRNNETLCNCIFPLRGPSVPLASVVDL
ncbi:hypothetical protein ACLOJK_005040 [Asimina triloba]